MVLLVASSFPFSAQAGGTTAYYPSSYNLLGSTQFVSGSLSDLQSDDGSYLTFRSYPNYDFRYAESLEESSWNASTAYQDKVVLTFTPPMPADYILIATAEVQGACEPSYDVKARLYHGTSVYQELIYRIQDTTDWYPFCALKRIYLPVSPQTFKIQYAISNTAATAKIRNARLYAFSLSGYYAESESESSTTSTTWQDKVTLTFTPPTSGDYLIMATANVGGSSTSYSTLTRLVQDGSIVHAGPIKEPGASGARYTFGVMRKVNLDATSHTFKIQYASESSLKTAYIKYAHIVAIRVDQFSNVYYAENEGESGPAAPNTWYDKVTNTYTAQAADHIIIGSILYKSGSTSYSVGLSLLQGSAVAQEPLIEHRDTTDYEACFMTTKASLPAGSTTDKIQYMGESTYARVKNARLISLQLPTVQYTVEVEFRGSSDTLDWTQLVWTVDSAWTTPSVTVTLQLYNYNLGQYPTSGNGYISYVSSATANTDETKSQTITLNPTHFRDASGNWKIKVKGVKSTTTQFDFKADLVKYEVLLVPTPPPLSVSITPTSVTMNLGQHATFNSTVSGGTPPYYYQWYLNNTAVSGAKASGWTFTPTSTGFYTVYVNVTDSVGVKAKSNIASVTVNPALSVSISPTSATIDLGQSKPFTSTVSGGTPPYRYQWFLNGAAVSGANASSWTFTPTSAGFYTVYLNVTDGASVTAKSNVASVTVNPALAVFISPTTVTINLGQSVTFHSTVSGGTQPYFYQWYLSGTAVSGAINPSWTFTPTSTGSYTVYLNVSDSADVDPWVISNIVNVTVNPQLTASISPPSTTITLGQSVLFNAIVSGGTSPYSYKWDVNGTWLPEETNPTFNFTPTQPGVYNISLFVTDGAGANASAFALVTVQQLKYYLTVKTDPAGITTILGEGWYNNCTYVTLTAPQFVPSESGVGGQRYRFANWTVNGGVFTTLQITVHMDANHTAIAHYVLQYYLSMSTNFGTVSPGSGWHDAGSTVQISASAPSVVGGERYIWLGWTGSGDGSYTGMNNPATVTMNSPITQTAAWRHEYYLTVNSPYDSPSPTSGWFEAGTLIIASVTSPVSGPTGTRYLCTGWTGTGSVPPLGTATTVTFTINAPSTITWTWKTQYYLTVSSAHGTTGGSGWYNASDTAYATVTPLTVPGPTGTRYVFTHWSGDASGNTSPSNPIIMNAPKTATANWKTQYYLTVRTDPPGIVTIPGEGWYDATTTVPLTAPSVAGYDFLNWDVDGVSQGAGVASITVSMNTPHTATAHYQKVAPPPAVGGYAAPINIAIGKEASPLLASQISLAFALLAAMVASILLIRRRSKTLK